ncbi:MULTISPECIES: hypothetical protein [unclassified Bradyrhizobium]|uniref:hypothetical protein n=1 Tax=unclassified Bradyrhizobium TaxID=2631580 RepID=UPI0029168139|nr:MULTISPECIES: hypothetical protein [unclassified Bradyrhizobium]
MEARVTTRRGFLGAMLGAPIAAVASKEVVDARRITNMSASALSQIPIELVGIDDLAEELIHRRFSVNEIRQMYGLPPIPEASDLLVDIPPSVSSELVEIGDEQGVFIVPKDLAPLMGGLLAGDVAFIDSRGAYKRGVGDHTPELLAPWEYDPAATDPEPISPRAALSIGASPDGGAAIPSRSPAGRPFRWVL